MVTRSSSERPPDIDAAAEWDSAAREWRHLARDAEGREHGFCRSWRSDGSLATECWFERGVRHGPFRRLHPNGQIAQEGTFVDGVLHGDVVAFASDEATPERLRSCCIPPNAWSMRSRYEAGALRNETFFDRHARRLLSDGSVHPERPDSVSPDAVFDAERKVWVSCTYAAGQRSGPFSCWAQSGDLLQAGSFAHGRRDGVWRTYSDGALVSSTEYVEGQRHGAHERQLSESESLEAEVAREHGSYDADRAVGIWRITSTSGRMLTERDLGLPCASEAGAEVFDDERRSGSAWLSAAARFREERRCGEAVVAVARAAAQLHDAELLRTTLAGQTLVRPRHTAEKLAAEVTAVEAPSISGLLAALLVGATPAVMFHAVSRAVAGAASIDLMDAAVLLDPERDDLRASRAVALAQIGDLERARNDIATLPSAAASTEMLAAYVQALYAPFAPVAATESLLEVAPEELPDEVQQPLERVRATTIKCALRIQLARNALEARLARSGLDHPRAAWFPPDMSPFLQGGAPELARWQFTIVEECQPITITVDECFEPAEMDVPTLLRAARADWTALCWITWAVGLDEPRPPEEIAPRPQLRAAIATALQRHWRCDDRVVTSGLRARVQGVPSFVWHGMDIDELPRPAVEIARESYREMRAALFWITDAECQSLWQDDLRP